MGKARMVLAIGLSLAVLMATTTRPATANASYCYGHHGGAICEDVVGQGLWVAYEKGTIIMPCGQSGVGILEMGFTLPNGFSFMTFARLEAVSSCRAWTDFVGYYMYLPNNSRTWVRWQPLGGYDPSEGQTAYITIHS